MNCIILSIWNDNSEVLVITKDNMYFVSGAEKYYLKGKSKGWFDEERVREYAKSLNLLPCVIIDCTNGYKAICVITS